MKMIAPNIQPTPTDLARKVLKCGPERFSEPFGCDRVTEGTLISCARRMSTVVNRKTGTLLQRKLGGATNSEARRVVSRHCGTLIQCAPGVWTFRRNSDEGISAQRSC